MKDMSVASEHVDLFNARDGLDIQFLQGSLELLVVATSGLGHLLDFSSGSALSTNADRGLEFCQFFRIHLVRWIDPRASHQVMAF